MNWILMVIIHAGVLAHNDDVTIQFQRTYTEAACIELGKDAESKMRLTHQSVDYVCSNDPVKI
jgi:outer membrane lipopolysaccharide assembly protein LptE/RlpB